MGTPKVILVDCDGVLTDGHLTIDHKGQKLFKRFHSRDVRAIRELILNGYEVIIISADDWGGTDYFAEKVGATFLYCRNKCEISEQNFIAIGDDTWDVPLLKSASIAFCPADADAEVKGLHGVYVLKTVGGRGVMAEVCRILMGNK